MAKENIKLKDIYTYNQENNNIDKLNENYDAQRSNTKKSTVSTKELDIYGDFDISETQIFGDFLYLRMIPKNRKEKIRIILFDEKINENSTGIFINHPPMFSQIALIMNSRKKEK